MSTMTQLLYRMIGNDTTNVLFSVESLGLHPVMLLFSQSLVAAGLVTVGP